MSVRDESDVLREHRRDVQSAGEKEGGNGCQILGVLHVDDICPRQEIAQRPDGRKRLGDRVRHPEPLSHDVGRADAEHLDVARLFERGCPARPRRRDRDLMPSCGQPVREDLHEALDAAHARAEVRRNQDDAHHRGR